MVVRRCCLSCVETHAGIGGLVPHDREHVIERRQAGSLDSRNLKFSAAVTKVNREQSLCAMWQAFRARSFVDQRTGENGAGVFQNPLFWELGLTQDGQGALLNPQALNSYGYANDNPVSNKDSPTDDVVSR